MKQATARGEADSRGNDRKKGLVNSNGSIGGGKGSGAYVGAGWVAGPSAALRYAQDDRVYGLGVKRKNKQRHLKSNGHAGLSAAHHKDKSVMLRSR